MPRYQFAKVARAALLDELIAAGFPATTRVEMDATRCWVTCAPEDFDRAAGIVAAHDAAAIDAAGATRAAEETADVAAFAGIYQAIRQRAADFRADAAAMPATLTGAQVRARLIAIENGLADLADIVASLGRYVGRRAPPDDG